MCKIIIEWNGTCVGSKFIWTLPMWRMNLLFYCIRQYLPSASIIDNGPLCSNTKQYGQVEMPCHLPRFSVVKLVIILMMTLPEKSSAATGISKVKRHKKSHLRA